ncbi:MULTISPECIES: hypothetical protein [unclassified Roseitalea]|uniref:hypothetical protein n=1 Tax=unclassified Roseitalea TaxID=2639107 RepID=UPI00273E9846|nr:MULTISPECIES: hypothetical protein [unclassified Roseitalea]
MDPDRSRAPFWTEMRWLVAVLAAILMLPPVLPLLDRPVTVFGLPLLPVYLFAVWAVAIALCAIASRHALRASGKPDGPG